MKKKHKAVIIIFVPGGCTGIWQPLDVGIQRVMKLCIKCSAHCDIVNEVMAQMASGKTDITIDTTLGTLRNRTVDWIVREIYDINDKNLILKVSHLSSYTFQV